MTRNVFYAFAGRSHGINRPANAGTGQPGATASPSPETGSGSARPYYEIEAA